jgi:hypothetical protein
MGIVGAKQISAHPQSATGKYEGERSENDFCGTLSLGFTPFSFLCHLRGQVENRQLLPDHFAFRFTH